MKRLLAGYLLVLTLMIDQEALAFQTDSIDQALTEKLTDLINDFEGNVGIYVNHLGNLCKVEINADELYPTASMIKVPILLTLFSRIEAGELAYNDKMLYKDSLLYGGDDILGSFKDGEEITLSKLVLLMITMSDNTASLWCQLLAGTGTEVNRWLIKTGMKGTRINSRTPGREESREKFGWGQTTPREMANLVKMIYQGKAISKSASEEMQRVLGTIYWRSEALSQIPPVIATMSKQGAVSQSRSEVVLVHAPSGPYVFCIITKDQKDMSWEHDNAGYELIRDVSKILWQHFEPDYPYEPPVGSNKWLK